MPTEPFEIGKYRVLRKLAGGGMGEVFLATDPILDRPVAIKLLRDGFDNEELRQRFGEEAKNTAKLAHPNIVTIYEYGEHSGRPFIAMEYIAGQSLAEIIRHREPVPLSRRLRLIEELCAGLEHAHRAQIIHRDIKPANLMVAPSGNLKVLDFGIAKLRGTNRTQKGMLVGTINYMSPEQIMGQPVDHRSDVFAVGSVLYEFLTYEQAFRGDLSAAMYGIVHGEPEPLGKRVPGVDPALEAIVATCLAKDPRARYQDLGEAERDLARVRRPLEAAEAEAHDDAGVTDRTVVIRTTPGSAPSTDPSRAQAPGATTSAVGRMVEEAQARLGDGRFDSAIRLARQALSADATNAPAADVVQRAERGRRAAEISSLSRQIVDDAAAHRLTDAQAALSRLEALGAHVEAHTLSAHLERAREVSADARHENAVAERVAVAGRLEKAGEVEAAIAMLAAIERPTPDARQALVDTRGRAVSALVERARRALEHDRVDDASGLLDRARAIDPSPHAVRTLATALDERREQLGQLDRALQDGREALARADMAAARRHAAAARAIRAHDERLATLVADIDGAEATRRAHVADELAAVERLVAAGSLDDALSRIDALARTEPHEPELAARAKALRDLRTSRAEMARLLGNAEDALARGDLRTAERAAEAAAALDPANADAGQLRARVADALAAEAREQARRREAREHATRVSEALTRAREARDDAAVRAAVADVLALDPDNLDARGILEQHEARLELARQRREQKLAQAQQALARGVPQEALTALASLDEAEDDPTIRALRKQVDDALARARAEQRRVEAIRDLLERASRAAGEDRFDEADRLVAEASQQLERGDTPGLEPLRQSAAEGRDRVRQQRLLYERVQTALATAGEHTATGDFAAAIAVLEAFSPSHPHIAREMGRLERQRRASERTARIAAALGVVAGLARDRRIQATLGVVVVVGGAWLTWSTFRPTGAPTTSSPMASNGPTSSDLGTALPGGTGPAGGGTLAPSNSPSPASPPTATSEGAGSVPSTPTTATGSRGGASSDRGTAASAATSRGAANAAADGPADPSRGDANAAPRGTNAPRAGGTPTGTTPPRGTAQPAGNTTAGGASVPSGRTNTPPPVTSTTPGRTPARDTAASPGTSAAPGAATSSPPNVGAASSAATSAGASTPPPGNTAVPSAGANPTATTANPTPAGGVGPPTGGTAPARGPAASTGPPASGTGATSGPSAVVAAEQGIRQLLAEYARAYGQLDEGRLRQLHPGFGGIPSTTRQLASRVSLTFVDALQINVAPSGESATVRGSYVIRYEWKRSGMPPQGPSTSFNWTLRKEGTRWIIDS